jgi:hypothetical protein
MARAIEPGVKPGVESNLRAKSLKIARWGGNVRGRVLARLARLCPGERGTVNGVEARARIRERLRTFVDEKRGSLNRIGKALNISSGNLSVFLRNGKGVSPERLERVSAYLAEHEHDRPEGTVAPLLAFPPVAKPVEGVPSGAEPETERIVAVAPLGRPLQEGQRVVALDYVCPRCGAEVPDPVETPYCHCGACGVTLVHTCRECGAVETRVDARFCCLCGKAF